MTVKQMIERLQKLPQEAEACYFDGHTGESVPFKSIRLGEEGEEEGKVLFFDGR